jgi:uncharacterized membrane protein
MSDATLSRESLPRLEEGLAVVRRCVRLDAGEAAVALRVVYAGTAAYSLLFAGAAVLHYAVFQTAQVDLGHMVQAVWNTRHGHFLQFTTLEGHERNRLGYHVDPFLLVFVPLFWVWSNPVLMPLVQALAVASGALPVFWLARKHLDSPRAGAHFAFAYLLYPATQFTAFTITSSFHSVAMAVPLVLYAIWFLDEDRLIAFSLVALVAFTTKEEIPLAVGCLGIWYAVRKGRRLLGLTIFAAGLAVTLFDFLWLIPHYSATGIDPFVHRYRAVGGTPGGIAHKLVTDPGAFVQSVATGHKALYLAILLVPLLGFWLFEPLLLLGAIPDLAINLLSSEPDQTSINYHWSAGIVPFLVAASIFGVARFKRHGVRLSLWAVAGAGAFALWSPILLASSDVGALGSAVVSAKARAVSMIPSGVPVSASIQLGGHLSERRYIYTFPTVHRSRWIVVDINDPTYGDSAGFKRMVRKYRSDRAWQSVFSSHGVAVLHRRAGVK